jgi:hypothetical protein
LLKLLSTALFSSAKERASCVDLPNPGHIRMTDGGVHTGYYFIKWLGSHQTEPLYLDFSYHLESLYAQPP